MYFVYFSELNSRENLFLCLKKGGFQAGRISRLQLWPGGFLYSDIFIFAAITTILNEEALCLCLTVVTLLGS